MGGGGHWWARSGPLAANWNSSISEIHIKVRNTLYTIHTNTYNIKNNYQMLKSEINVNIQKFSMGKVLARPLFVLEGNLMHMDDHPSQV